MQRRKTLSHIGFDDVFARMWQLYLAHAEAGFRSGYLDVYQWTFAQGGHAVIVDLAIIAGASIAALLALHGITLAIGHRIGRYNVVDVAWGLGFIVVATVAALLGHGDPFRRALMLALVTIWAGRLSWYILRKTAGKGEDPRYADMLRGAGVAQVALKVFALQAVMTWFISLPLQLSAVSGPTRGPCWS